jgi:hypothetical protein
MIARRIGVSFLARKLDLDPLVVIEVARMLGIPVRSRASTAGTSLTVSEADAAAIKEEWQKQLSNNSLLRYVATSERDRRSRLSAELSETRDRLQRHFHGPFVASSRKKHFHRWSCKWATSLRRSPARMIFSSHEEAVHAGYRPCKTCRS